MTEVAVVDTSAAEHRALRIGLRLDSIADNYEAVMPMIREALELGDHATLGYASPGAYLADRFGKALARLPIPVRRAAVGELTAAGLSTRAIAPIVGVTRQQVSNDLQVASHLPPAIERSIERGLAQVAAGQTTHRDDLLVDHETGEITDAPAPTALPKVTGLDGKSYSRPAPKAPSAPPRRPLPDQFFDAIYDLTKVTERIERLAADDRFAQNAEKVAAKHRSDLLRARDLLEQVIDRLA